MQSRLRTLRTLSPAELRNLGLAWLCLLIAGLALRVLPLPRIERLLARFVARFVSSREVLPLEPGRLARLVRTAARYHPLPFTCLPQSLVLQALLCRQGVDASLRIGVLKEDGTLRAHAWVEHAGRPIADPEGIGSFFRPLTSIGNGI